MKIQAMSKNLQAGFTLIELMIVVAIIGILAAVALPSYQDYAMRGRVSELAILGSAMKAGVMDNIVHNGGVISAGADYCLGVAVLSSATRNAKSNSCTGSTGAIIVSGTAAAGDVVLTFTPTVNGSGVTTWKCTTPATHYKYVPAECRQS
ncbi:MAG TPA: pilin [Telluria sp.]